MPSTLVLEKALKRLMKSSKKENIQPTKSDYVSTGSALINLAITGSTRRGFRKGRYYYFVGDSQSGKTFFTIGIMAQASINPNFDEYRFIFDNAEDGALMDIKRYFGKKLLKRMESPGKNGKCSSTIQELYYHLDDARKVGKPMIYVLDSMDVLSTEQSEAKFQERKKAYLKGAKTTGSYGDSKAAENSGNLRRFMKFLKESGSIIILISQTRDNLGRDAMFNPQSRSGGKALTFLATCEMWTSIRGAIKRKVGPKDRKIGMWSRVHIKKNRQTGQDHTVLVPFYYSVGVDDLGSCVMYLIEEKYWKGSKQNMTVKAPDFDFKGKIDDLIAKIEEEGKEKKLRNLVKKKWASILKKCEVRRKNPYG